MTVSEFAREPKDRSVADLPEGAEPDVGEDPATLHQAYARLMSGKPFMGCGRSGFIQTSRGAGTSLVNYREWCDSTFVSNIANPGNMDFSCAAWVLP